jgi:hypothetical protein
MKSLIAYFGASLPFGNGIVTRHFTLSYTRLASDDVLTAA